MESRTKSLALTLTLGITLSAAACAPSDAPQRASADTVQPPVVRIPLPSPYVAGYAQDLGGEVLQYHSPIPSVGTSLLVRSEDRGRSIAWESAEVPAEGTGGEVTFALMAAIDVNSEPRSYDLRVDGRDVLRFRNPVEASKGEVLRWTGEGGVSADFHVTLMDRHGDAMGFLYLTLPWEMVEAGEPVRFEVLGESAGARTWFMVFREPMGSWIDVRNAPAVLRSEGGETQIVRLDLVDIEGGQRFRLESAIGGVDTVTALGHTRMELPVPAVDAPTPVQLRVQAGDHLRTVEYVVTPPRRMEVYLLHHTHLDIGYTHHQDEVERLQWQHLEQALELGEASADLPEAARFVWNPEANWAVDTYVRAHPGEKTERLMEGVRQGWIELGGLYGNELTGLFNEEGLLRAFDAGRRLGEMSGVPPRAQMLSDIPGFSWGLVHALAENGIRYLSIGPNSGHRIGHFTEALGDRPFWWQGPVGEERVLTWISGGGYSRFHSGLGYERITTLLDEEAVFGYVEELQASEYPWDLVYLRYNIGSDNGPPDPTLSAAVQAWNERYASPALRISGPTAFFQEFEERHGEDLPTLRGDLTGHWEDGAASSARETALTRRTAESLVQAEALAQVLDASLDAELLDEAWRNVLLFYEHTWGSWNSISEPESELTVTSWERKKAFAERAAELARGLLQGLTEEPSLPPGVVEVVNALDWPRTDLVVLPADRSSAGDAVRAEGGSLVPSQRLSTGELAFLAEDVPALGRRRFVVEEGEATPPAGSSGATASAAASSHYAVRLDPATGAVASLVHVPSGRELVQPGEGPLNTYVYVAGRDPAALVSGGPGEARMIEEGPLVWSLEATVEAPGSRRPLVSRIRLVEGLDRVEMENVVSKAWVLDPEAVLFRFPFAVEDPVVRMDVPFGWFRPEVDQVPGAAKNYFSVQRWIDVSGPTGGVTLTTIDAPLIQLGEVRTDPIVVGWVEEAAPSATLYSYVMNNYWETNYRAAQDDEVVFRYAVRAHGGFDETAAERFGLERARPLTVRWGS